MDPSTAGTADHIVQALLSGFARWDAVYFLHLAQTVEYEFEQFHAFFPFLPACIRGTAFCLRTIFVYLGVAPESVLSPEALLLVAGSIVTHATFIAAALVLYELSFLVLGSERLALHSSVFFCFSPASIFFSAIYTESPFALASFACMFCFLRAEGPDVDLSGMSTLKSGAWFLGGVTMAATATAIRSNGIVLAAFGLHVAIRQVWIQCLGSSKADGEKSRQASCSDVPMRTRAAEAMKAVLACALCLLVALPFIRFQQYGHELYCSAKGNSVPPVQHSRPWCKKGGISNLYAFVQSEYWNQGPFRYWTLKQIPNFLLATPVLLLSFFMACCFRAARTSDLEEKTHIIVYLVRLVGFDTVHKNNHHRGSDNGNHANQKGRRRPASTLRSVFVNRKTAAFVWHCSALALLMFTCFHVQVATRFLFAASPALYWYVADIVERWGENSWTVRLVLTYFCVYFILGASLFSAFYPWT